MSGLEKGLIQVYTGEGKGKTTAALGQALRAAGQGLRVFILQFLKGERESGERAILEGMSWIQIEAFGGSSGWVNHDRLRDEDRECARSGLSRARSIVEGDEADLLVLDEINVAIAFGLLTVEEVIELLNGKPASMEIILTGRRAHPKVLERADLVTEMRQVKHPYERGVGARRGIEY